MKNKNLNLIKRLWTDSHEKQSPQRFARYAVMLIMLLTVSVGQMWAWSTARVAGSGFSELNNWDPKDTRGTMTNTSGSIWSKTFTGESASSHEFKITFDGSWDQAVGWNTVTYTGCSTASGNNNGNISFTPSAAGDVTITYNSSNNNITITCTSGGGGGGGGGEPPTYYYRGQLNNWNSTAMTPDAGGTFAYYSASGRSNFKITSCNCWDNDKQFTTVDNSLGTLSLSGGANLTEIKDNNNSSHYILIYYENQHICAVSSLPSSTYTVTYDANGGSGTLTDSNSPYDPGSNVTVLSNTFTRTGYHFTGWKTGPSSGTSYAAGGTISSISANVILYAQWSADSYSTTNNIKESDGKTNAGTYQATYDATSITYVTEPTKTGYNIEGLYKQDALTNKIVNSNRSLCASTSYTTSASKWNQTSAPTLYVKWQVKTYTASNNLDKNGGTSHGKYTATYNATSIAINTNPSRSGYYILGYYKESGCTNKIAEADGTLLPSTSYTDANGRWINDGNVTLYTKWEQNTVYFVNTQGWTNVNIYGWNGNGDGGVYGGWPGTPMADAGFDVTIDGRTYDVYKKADAGLSGYNGIIFNNGESSGSSNKQQTADLDPNDAIGKYFMADECFGNGASVKPDDTYYNSVDDVEAAGISCYKDHRVTFGVVGSTGGTIAGRNTTTSSDISSGAIVGLTNSISLTATPSEGYGIEGWYSDAAGTVNINHSKDPYTKTFTSSDEDITVYVKFEALHTVTLNATNGKVQAGGVDVTSVNVASNTTATLTAVPAEGYYFTSWTIDAGITDGSGSAVSTSANPITIKTSADDKTITANFAPDEKIYFDNTYSKWSNVYVYLFNDNTYWTNSKENGVHPKDHLPTGFAPVAMTKVAGTDNLYEYAYHTSSHNYSFSYVAFSEVDMHNYNVFGKDKHAVYRGDWHKNLPVYVATEGYERVQIDKDDAAGGGYGLYHSGGYWRPYNPKAGESVKYYLDVFRGTADFQGETQFFKASGDGSLVAEVSARLTDANTTYTFGVHSDAGGGNNQHYAEGTTITNENSDNYLKLYKYNSSWNISVKTTSEGIYTFVLSMEYDSLRFSVIYPASVGDYRLTYSYDSPAKTRSSDIIKKKVADTGDAIKTSMYVDPTNAYSQLILERCSVITDGKPVWETRKTFDHSYITLKFATKEVYEMDVTITGTNGSNSTLSNIAKYSGPFYIKTDCASGGWADYTKNVLEQNSINYSALDSKTFNYYFVKYVEDARKKYGTNGWDACNLFDNAGNKTNIKCVIANMYNSSISDTLKSDVITGDGQETLPMPGSVRFSYNSATNEIKRTYLNGSTCWADAYLLLTADKTIKTPAGVSIAGNATTFADKNNWVYELQIKAPETTKVWLKATFNSTPQDLIGTSSSYQTLIGGSNADHYQLLRIIYDFKTNKLIAAWEPDQRTVYSGETIDLASDVLMIHNRRTVASATEVGKIDDVTMINLTTGGGFTGIGRIYCAMRFQKTSADGFVGLKTNTAGSEATALTSAESYYRFNYWISFPYDVKMTDIFGIDGYGSKWRIQRYRGDLRAQNGWYLGDGVGSFWETVPMSDTEKLNAKEGYVLQLSPSSFRSSAMWNNSATERYLYFPSGTDISVVGYTESSVTLTSLPCTKGTFSDPTQAAAGYSHNITDSHWHVFGIPTFYNATGTTGTGTYHNGDTDEGTTIENNVFYFYEYNNNGTTCNTYTAKSSFNYVFQPMHAYMIQMTGELNFTINSVPASMAARRINNAQNYDITVELTQNETVTDRAFISIRDSASADFAFNEDMMKIHNSGKTNIYSFAGPYDVAANVLPKENRSIKLGIEASESGMYTIHVPGNFSGIATLFDNVENKRTNLALEDYEIFLEKGKYEDRFFIEIDLNKMPTAIDGVSGGSLKDGKAHKFIQNGQMYILQNGVIYDAQGKRVK